MPEGGGRRGGGGGGGGGERRKERQKVGSKGKRNSDYTLIW